MSEKKGAGCAVLSRVRLARDLADTPYPGRLSAKGDAEARKKIAARIREAFFSGAQGLEQEFTYLDMDSLSPAKGRALVEEHLISPEFLNGAPGRALILSRDHRICVMINEEDHLRIQAFAPGFDLRRPLEAAQRIEKLLSEKLPFAYNDEFGYLTACHTNLGTGLRASVMAHLPAEGATGALRDLIAEAGRLGVTVRGNYGEGSSSAGDLYQISNVFCLGRTPLEIVERMEKIVSQIFEREEKLRAAWQKSDPEGFADSVWRAQGTARYARRLSGKEWDSVYSLLRLGAESGLFALDEQKLDSLYFSVRQEVCALAEPAARDRLRADRVRAGLEN